MEEYINHIFCLIILVLVLVGILLQQKIKEKVNKAFIILIIASFIYVLLSFISEFVDGKKDIIPFVKVINLISFFGVDIIIIAFNNYLTSVIDSSSPNRKYRYLSTIVICTSLIRFGVIIALFAAEKLFTISDGGTYANGSLSYIPYIISCFSIAELVSIILLNRKCLSIKQSLVILVYIILPLVGIAIELFSGLFSITSCIITLSVLILYILLQDSKLDEGIKENKDLTYISNTDQLTGLNNRRAYYSCIEKLDKKDNVGVLFCDLNGLKIVNDSFGHEKGDELIKKFSSLLLEKYRNEDCFRISGDEFVVLIPNLEQSVFIKRAKEFAHFISDDNNHIAAVGYSYGSVDNIKTLVNNAEALMYEDKKAYKLSI